MTDFSFQAITERMITKLRGKSSWARVLFFGTNRYLIDVLADEMAELARYREYLLRESKWDEAQNVSSLMTQSSIRGYKPKRAQGAIGTLRVATDARAFSSDWVSYQIYAAEDLVTYNNKLYRCLVDDTVATVPGTNGAVWEYFTVVYPVNIGLTRYMAFATKDGLRYLATEAVTLTPAQNYAEIPVVQGVLRTFEYSAQGIPFEEAELIDDTVDNSHYELFVNGEKWTEIDFIQRAGVNEKRYEIENMTDFSGLFIKFGDGQSGKQLSSGDDVLLRYVSTDGSAGNNASAGSVTSVLDPLYDMNGTSVQLFSYNKEPLTGGKDHDTADEIRVNAIDSFQSTDRLSSADDYAYHIRQFSFVKEAVVWGAYEKNLDAGNDPWEYIPANENFVYVSAYTSGATPQQLTTAQKLEIVRSLLSKKPPTDIIKFEPVVFLNMVFHVTAYIEDESFLLSERKQAIMDFIEAEYGTDQMRFRRSLYETNYKAGIETLDGVLHHNTYLSLFQEQPFTAGDDENDIPYSLSAELDLPPIKEGSLKVYVKDLLDKSPVYELAMHENTSGVLVADNSYVITASSLDKNSGGLSLVLSHATKLVGDYHNYLVRIDFELESLDVKLTQRNQILYLREYSDVTTVYES